MKKILASIVLFCATLAHAQYLTVTTPSNCLTDGSGAAISSGTMIIVGTDANDNTIPYRAGTAIMATTAPISRTITNGALATSLQLADPATTSPTNILYRFTIQDNASKRNTVYKQIIITPNDVPVSGSFTVFNFCKMNPQPFSTVQYGTIPLNVNGDSNITRDLTVGRNAIVNNNLAIGGPNPWWDVCQNGFACDGTTSDTAALNALITKACNAGGGTLWFPPAKTIRFGTAPNHIGCGLTLQGAYSKGSAFGFGSFIVCDYTEATPTNACLWWDGANLASQGNGGGIIGINVQKGNGQTGGAAVKMSGASCTSRAGNAHFESMKVSGSTGTFNYNLYLDGSNCTTAGTQGTRDNYFSDLELFNATTQSIFLNNCSHCQFIHLTTSIGSGANADVIVSGATGSTASSTDISIVAANISGSLTYDFASNVRCAACNVTGTFSATTNNSQSTFDGIAGAYGSINGVSFLGIDQTTAASQNGSITGSIRAQQSMVAGPSYPPNIVSGQINSALTGVNAATSGRIGFGTDGNMFCGRNNGSGAGTNFFCSFDALGTIPFQIDNVNGMTLTKVLTSTVGTGTAPIVVASTTNVAKLNASILTGSGTAATLSGTGACATITTQTGGGIAGRATCTGTTAASTITITPGLTAPNGWVCNGYDQTNRANLLEQTSTTTTTCVLTATSITQNDVFVFSVIAF